MRAVPEESETDDESVKDVRQIKHRDSVDILVEKLKSKRIQEAKIDEVEEVGCGTSETASATGVQEQANEARESNSLEASVSETCCSKKKSPTKELRFNKLADKLKHKSRRSRCNKSVTCCDDDATSN